MGPRDLKIVALESRGQCGAPGCSEPVLRWDDDSSEPAIIGEIAHIVSKSPQGPRGGDDPGPGGRNSHQNLILLCPTHHTQIDALPGSFPTADLRGWKRQLRRRAGSVIATLRPDPVEPWSVATDRPDALVDNPEITDANIGRRLYNPLKAAGAIDLHTTRLSLTLYNPNTTPVLIEQVSASVASRHLAPARAALQHPTAGAFLASVLRIELEDASPTAEMLYGENDLHELAPGITKGRVRIQLASDEIHTCIIEAFTRTHDIEWRLCLDAVTDGHTHTIVLDNDGQPFRTTGLPDSGPTSVWLLPGIAGPRLRRAVEYEAWYDQNR